MSRSDEAAGSPTAQDEEGTVSKVIRATKRHATVLVLALVVVALLAVAYVLVADSGAANPGGGTPAGLVH
jgi:uncharacterized protein involved in exopolysaccharide biosynthesis